MQGFLRTYADIDLQAPMDVAVVIPTVLRPTLAPALRGIFAQRFPGRIHILIGIDTMRGDLAMIDAVCAERPPHCAVQVFWPGYSTSVRNGGLTPPGDGGALRATLTYLANSPYVAYLDDDNWWDPQHLYQLRRAMDDAEWAFALRWFVHPETRRPVCIDIWESVGPGQGIFNEHFGELPDDQQGGVPAGAASLEFPAREGPDVGGSQRFCVPEAAAQAARHRPADGVLHTEHQ
jgi:hypothetical protein